MEADLNEEIRRLKEEGLSLRGIATALGVSHEAVRKRLKTVKDKDQVSTTAEDPKLTASTIKKEKVSTGSNARKSRVCEQVRDAVNQVSTPNTPSLPLSVSVNPLGSPTDSFSGRKEKVFQGVSSGVGDLFGAIREFLESKGIGVYPMEVESEAYQIRHDDLIIRFYVHRGR